MHLEERVRTGGRHIELSAFRKLPGMPFAYSSPKEYLRLWDGSERLEPDLAIIATGAKTFDDFRFLRLRWEVAFSSIGSKWKGVDTGGDFQPWLSPTRHVELWANNGRQAREFGIARHGTDAQVLQSSKLWFRPGLTYPYTSSIGFGPRIFNDDLIL